MSEEIYSVYVVFGQVYATLASGLVGQTPSSAMTKREEPQARAPAPLSHSKISALQHFRSAIATVESMRSLLGESEHKSGFLGTKLEAYEGLVELLIAEEAVSRQPLAVSEERKESPLANGQLLTANGSAAAAEAFAVAERMKARSFLDELGAAKFSRAGVSEELLQEKRLLEARIKWLRERQ